MLHELRKPARAVWGLTPASSLFGARTISSARDLSPFDTGIRQIVALMRLFLPSGRNFGGRRRVGVSRRPASLCEVVSMLEHDQCHWHSLGDSEWAYLGWDGGTVGQISCLFYNMLATQ